LQNHSLSYWKDHCADSACDLSFDSSPRPRLSSALGSGPLGFLPILFTQTEGPSVGTESSLRLSSGVYYVGSNSDSAVCINNPAVCDKHVELNVQFGASSKGRGAWSLWARAIGWNGAGIRDPVPAGGLGPMRLLDRLEAEEVKDGSEILFPLSMSGRKDASSVLNDEQSAHASLRVRLNVLDVIVPPVRLMFKACDLACKRGMASAGWETIAIYQRLCSSVFSSGSGLHKSTKLGDACLSNSHPSEAVGGFWELSSGTKRGIEGSARDHDVESHSSKQSKLG